MKVPFFDMAAELAVSRRDVDAAIAQTLDGGVFIGGPTVASFERALAARLGARAAIGVSSGTDALLATLWALGVGPGDEVVTTPLTFFATAGAAVRLGARIVFADVDRDSLNLDPAAAAAACSDRTRAVIPVHLFGRPARLPTVPVAIVEDAAQAIGAAPVAGVAATLSFFPTKILGALGDAGAVITDDEALADKIQRLREHGARPKYHHEVVGGNFRLDAMQAAILRAKLAKLDQAIVARQQLAARYRALLEAARLPAEVRLPAEDPRMVWSQYVIRTPRRDALRAWLAAAGIGTEVYYPEPLHLQPCFTGQGWKAGEFPEAEAACREVLALPIYPTLGNEAQAIVVDKLAAFFAGGQG